MKKPSSLFAKTRHMNLNPPLFRGDSWNEICLLKRLRIKIERRTTHFSLPPLFLDHCPTNGSCYGFETPTTFKHHCGESQLFICKNRP